ncbi:MAG: ice-binding family protein [Melioribacteraceae bacterium]|nr:ice-binding family protein [Melioribacteraceae bacterium]
MKTLLQTLQFHQVGWKQIYGMILISIFLIPSLLMAQSSPSPVNLGSAEAFVVLAKTGITATGNTDITGDLGISPAAATAITGFGLILDPSGTFSTSSLVTGKIYAADYTDPTPATLTAAISDMETAYTDAAGRTLPDYVELHAGDLTGQTLTRGVYKWGTGVMVSAGGVTISGTADDVWIFQIAQDLVLSNGANVYLSGGAKASNIFWQVAGQTTLGTTSVLHGIILCQTQIVMSTGATFNGRAFAQTAATLDGNQVADTVVTSVNDDTIITTFLLDQNYPNPFNPSTVIQYSIESAANVTLKVYNILGSEVVTLVNDFQEAGSYSIPFNTNDLVGGLSSGIYFYRLEAGSNVSTKKLVLMK